MADFLDEVAQYLEDNGVGTYSSDSGRNIFRNIAPPDPDNCVAILGLFGSTRLDSRQVQSLGFPRFQVYVRNTSYDAASAKLTEVRNLLHAIYGVTLPSWRILACHADQEGGPIGEDDQGRAEFVVNFTAEINAETSS